MFGLEVTVFLLSKNLGFYFNKLLILYYNIVTQNANLKYIPRLLMFYSLLSIRVK